MPRFSSSANPVDGTKNFDVDDPLFSLYVNAMVYANEGATGAGERYCRDQLERLPLLLRMELKELDDPSNEARPKKKAKTGARHA